MYCLPDIVLFIHLSHLVNVPNFQQPSPMMYFQMPYYGAMPVATPFTQPPLLMNAGQHPAFGSYPYMRMQQGLYDFDVIRHGAL